MAAPAWKWEWNLNTLVVLVGFASGFVTWGVTWGDMKSGRIAHEKSIERIDVRLSSPEVAIRRLDTHELRIAAMEKAATDAAVAMKSLDTTLNGLASDIKVTREILQRLEAAQKVKYQP